MQKNKKNLIIVGVVGLLVVIYLVLFNLSPKNQESLIAKCEEKPINLDKLNVCLQETQDLVSQNDTTRTSGKLNECLLEMKNLYLQKSGYEIPDKVKSDFKFKIFIDGKHSEVKLTKDGIHLNIERKESFNPSPCFMNILDPKFSEKGLSFIPADSKNLVICLDLASKKEFAYYSDDWGSAIEDEIKKQLIDLKKENNAQEIMNRPPSNAVSP